MMPSEKQKIALAFVIGLIIGSGATWLWFVSEPRTTTTEEEIEMGEEENIDEETTTPTTTTTTEGDTSSSVIAAQGDRIEVVNQIPGATVRIDNVVLAAPSWVVVHELSADGSLANALGARLVSRGTYPNTTVRLLRNTVGERTYAVVLYRDNGDRVFSLENDMLIVNGTNEPLQATFNTTSGAAGR